MEEEGRDASRKKKKMAAERKTGIADIPIDVLAEILSRLPAKFVWNLRSVCKRWRSVIQSPCFADLHLRRSKEEICLLVWGYEGNCSFQTRFYSIDNDGKAVRIVQDELVHPIVTTTSCLNGLICYYRCDPHIKVFNPVTHEIIILPKPTFFLTCAPNLLVIEIGFDSITKSYKLLAFKQGNPPEVEIFTLGGKTESWRKVQQVPSLEIIRLYDRTYANGCIYWFTTEYYHPHADGNMICSLTVFNFAQEKFEFVPLPPDIDILKYDYWMGEVGGCLCLVEAERIEVRNTVKLRTLTNSGTQQVWVDQIIAMPMFTDVSSAFPISSGVMLVHTFKNREFCGQYICHYNEQGQVAKSVKVDGIPHGFEQRRVHSESLVSLRSILAREL